MEFNGRILSTIAAILFSAISFSAWASSSASFDGHTQFESIELDGHVFVRCSDRGQHDSRWVRCRGNLLNPTGAFAHFQVNSGIRTDRVQLKSIWENGKQVAKRPRWEASKNRTQRSVNLWIDTIFQTPLLDYGNNWVEYELVENGTGRTPCWWLQCLRRRR
jgi:hypothetical protein